MELITLTHEIKEIFGLTAAHITIDTNDYIVQIKQIGSHMINFTCPNLQLRYGQLITITFQSKFGKVSAPLIIDCFYDNGIMLVVECLIQPNNNIFFMEFNNFILKLIEQKKRKEERILCTQRNLEKLNLVNTFIFDFRYRNLKGIIKDISYSGIKVLSSPILLEEQGNLFTFRLKFLNPSETFLFINCPIVRKKLFTFEGKNFSEVVFKLNDNLKFKDRLEMFFSSLSLDEKIKVRN